MDIGINKSGVMLPKLYASFSVTTGMSESETVFSNSTSSCFIASLKSEYLKSTPSTIGNMSLKSNHVSLFNFFLIFLNLPSLSTLPPLFKSFSN